jgi:hypothetical protein
MPLHLAGVWRRRNLICVDIGLEFIFRKTIQFEERSMTLSETSEPMRRKQMRSRMLDSSGSDLLATLATAIAIVKLGLTSGLAGIGQSGTVFASPSA